MAFDDRLQYLVLGMLIGFVLGYVVRLLMDVREELDEVKSQHAKDHGESGFMRHPIASDIAIMLVVVFTLYASFVSQRASNDVQDAQDRSDIAVACTVKIQGAALNALNERSIYTKAIADANIDLQQSQSDFFGLLLHQPAYPESEQRAAADTYYNDLQQFLTLAQKGAKKVVENPFPTVEDLRSCLNGEEGKQ